MAAEWEVQAHHHRSERLTDLAEFPLPIEGASGPQAHPSFIDFFDPAAFGWGHGPVAGGGEGRKVELGGRVHDW